MYQVYDVDKHLQEWGYYLAPPDHDGCPGYGDLTVLIAPPGRGDGIQPAHYFHVTDLYTAVFGWHNHLYHTTFGAHPLFWGQHPLPSGQIQLNHHASDHFTFYTFGGEMDVANVEGQGTRYVFHSSAPILALNEQDWTLADFLASETEAMLAKLRSSWSISPDAFDETFYRLYNPAVLYMASIQSILLRHEQHLPFDHAQFILVLKHEQKWLEEQNLWMAHLPPLEALPLHKTHEALVSY